MAHKTVLGKTVIFPYACQLLPTLYNVYLPNVPGKCITMHLYLNLLQSISDISETGTLNFCLPQETPRSSASFLTTSSVYSLTITAVYVISSYAHTLTLGTQYFIRIAILLSNPALILR